MDRIDNNRGFTLIEVLVAMAVLAVGIMALQTMQITSIKGNARASRITTSALWATDRLEQLYVLPYRDTTLACADDPLCDRDGDGTDQDVEMDGLDTLVSDGSDTSFGLDDDTQATADSFFTSPDGIHSIFVNIATDHPVPNNKTIRVIILSNQFGDTRRVEYTFIKTDII